MIRGEDRLREMERNRPKPGEVRTGGIVFAHAKESLLVAGYVYKGSLVTDDRVEWAHKRTGARAVTVREVRPRCKAMLKAVEGVEFVWDAERRTWLARPVG